MTFPVDKFIAFTESLEGKTDWMYLDVKGLVTIGDGNLIDPSSLLAGLTFTRPDGTPASASEISAEWLRVKNRRDLALKGGGAYAGITHLRVTPESLAALIGKKVARFASDLTYLFPEFDTWPEGCQIAAMSMCWAMGDANLSARFPHWVAACRDEDWAEAARQCHMSEVGQNASFRKRNACNAEMFANAARNAVTGH